MLPGGLDRRVAAFLRVELTHPTDPRREMRGLSLLSCRAAPRTPKFVPGWCWGWSGWVGGWDLGGEGAVWRLQRQVPAVQVLSVLDGAPDPVHRQNADLRRATETSNRRVPTGAVLGQGADVPVAVHVGMLRTVEDSQLQSIVGIVHFLDEVVDVPVVVHVRGHGPHSAARCSCWTGCARPCDHAATSSRVPQSMAVFMSFRRSEGFFGAFCAFFALSQLVWS